MTDISTRRSTLLALLTLAFTLTSLAMAVVLEAANGSSGSYEDIFWLMSWLGFPCVGALIVARRPRHRVGWVLSGIGVCLGFALLGDAYAGYARVHGTSGFAVDLAVVIPSITVLMAFGLIPFLILLFPEGRAHSKLGRLAGWIGVVVIAVDILLEVFG